MRARPTGPRASLPPGRVGALDGAQRPDLRERLRLALGELGERLFERGDSARERLDRLGYRIGEVDPVGVGTLHGMSFDAHGMTGVADDGGVRRDVCDDHAVRADLGAVADRDRTEQLRARADRDVVLLSWVALARLEAGAAERDALVERDVVADLRGLADHDTGAVVDEETLPDLCGGVDLDA